jgi:hypothetical protein
MTRALAVLIVVSNFQLRYDPAVLHRHEIRHLPRLTNQENGTDIPTDVAPARDQIVFPDNGRPYDPDTITFYPLTDPSVANFARAYPQLTANVAALRRKQLVAADPLTVDATHAFHHQVKPLKFPWGEGIAFLTQYTQEPDMPHRADNKELAYVFLGVTSSGSHFVRAQFAVRHDRFPMPHKDLETLPATSFRPPLDAIEQVLASIALNSPVRK